MTPVRGDARHEERQAVLHRPPSNLVRSGARAQQPAED